jgi:hypothetical protein
MALLSSALVPGVCLGCKCDREAGAVQGAPSSAPSATASVSPGPPSPDVLFWDFSAPDAPSLLSLWPADSTAPSPKAVGIKTTNEQGAAVIVVEGTNPHAEWSFSPPIDAGLLSFDIETTKIEKLHVSVRSKNCPPSASGCAWSETLGIGRQPAEFVLPVSQISALRVQFPEELGTSLTLHRLRLLREPKATKGFRSGHPSAQIMLTNQGLQIATPVGDPSIVLQVAGLEASAVSRVEIDVGSGEFAPQLFWEGTSCSNFSEECSVRLSKSGGHFAANLADHPKWSGRIEGLRLDPADPPGAYVIKRLALQRRAQVPSPGGP